MCSGSTEALERDVLEMGSLRLGDEILESPFCHLLTALASGGHRRRLDQMTSPTVLSL